MIETLQSWADDRGYRVAWGPAEVLRRARAELLDRLESGELDTDFCRDQLEFLFEPDMAWRDATVVVVAMPRPAHKVGFELGDGPPLVLIAGLGATCRIWGSLPELLGRQFRVIAVDNRGVGGSRAGEPFTLAGAANDLRAVLDDRGVARL